MTRELITRMETLGLTPQQIEQSCETIEKYLEQTYPVIATLYHTEIVKKVHSEIAEDRRNNEREHAERPHSTPANLHRSEHIATR